MKEKFTLPNIDWDETFEKLRELADKADSLASDIEESEEYHNRHADRHDEAYAMFKELTGIMKQAAGMAEDVGIVADEYKEAV